MYYSGQEIVEIAVRIEENGNAFYTAAANMIKEDTEIRRLFFDLAEKEIVHIAVFQRLAEKFDAESFDFSTEDCFSLYQPPCRIAYFREIRFW
jgi:rubrerythrin